MAKISVDIFVICALLIYLTGCEKKKEIKLFKELKNEILFVTPGPGGYWQNKKVYYRNQGNDYMHELIKYSGEIEEEKIIEINWKNSGTVDPTLPVELLADADLSYYFATGSQYYRQVVSMQPGHRYLWDPWDYEFLDLGEMSGSSSVIGTWERQDQCFNINGIASRWKFGPNTGHFFNTDCASACEDPFGYYMYFDYTISGNTLEIDWTSVSSYCGVSVDTPAPSLINFSVDGNNLIIEGSGTFVKI